MVYLLTVTFSLYFAIAFGGSCVDQYSLCPFWASRNQCKINKQWMMDNCNAACGSCTSRKIIFSPCADQKPQCNGWKASAQCKRNAHYMLMACPRACGFCTKSGENPYPIEAIALTSGKSSKTDSAATSAQSTTIASTKISTTTAKPIEGTTTLSNTAATTSQGSESTQAQSSEATGTKATTKSNTQTSTGGPKKYQKNWDLNGKDKSFADEMLKAHNEARKKEGSAKPALQPLVIRDSVWDAGLSSQAQKWAENCVSEHSIKPGENKGYGENIASRGVVQPGSSDILDDKTAKKEMLKAMNNPEKGGWYDEKANYAYPNCPGDPTMANKNCGHYTQVVWADTKKVGCGIAQCKNLLQGYGGLFVVCQYSPPGNFNNQPPYKIE